jgi:hypothetical protein
LEQESSPRHSPHDLLRLVRQSLSDIGNALGNRFVRNRHITPYRLQQFFASDQSALTLNQTTQDLKRLWAQVDLNTAPE